MGKRPTLHRAELEVMKIIWGKGEATVRDVWEVLYRRRGLAYTSVASIMRKLEEKGFLTHRVVGRSYVYRPLVGEEEVSKGMLRDLLDRLFEGSVEKLLMALAEVEDISEEELDRLIEGYQRVDDVPMDEMAIRLLQDAARAIGESFSLQFVGVRTPLSEGDGWEQIGVWTETDRLPPIPETPDSVPAQPERFIPDETRQVWWIVPLRPEDDPVGILSILDGEASLPDESVRRIQRLVENSLLRCVNFSRRLAEERNRFGINLATNMGHDLTNIIAGGKWDLNTIHRALSSGVVELESDRTDVFNKAVEGLKNNLRFLQEMVDIYRALGAARAPCYESGDVGKYLREVCDLFSLSTSQRLDLVQNISTGCEAVVEPRLLKMAMFNLLVNAAHAIRRRDDGFIGGSIEVYLNREEGNVVFIVRDNGPGIRDLDGRLLDDREIARIFRAGYSTKGGIGGGLGLVWVKSIVEEFHQGTIRALNRPEGGAEIIIRFPCQSPERITA